jgi:hypothetical protein
MNGCKLMECRLYCRVLALTGKIPKLPIHLQIGTLAKRERLRSLLVLVVQLFAASVKTSVSGDQQTAISVSGDRTTSISVSGDAAPFYMIFGLVVPTVLASVA